MQHITLPSKRNEAGASAVEYALLASLIAAVIVVTVFVLGTKVFDLYDGTCGTVVDAMDGSTC